MTDSIQLEDAGLDCPPPDPYAQMWFAALLRYWDDALSEMDRGEARRDVLSQNYPLLAWLCDHTGASAETVRARLIKQLGVTT